jgi:hypothetical protein
LLKGNTMTPVQIRILIHAYYECEPFPPDAPPAVLDGIDWLVRNGMIETVPEDRPVTVTTVPSLPVYRTTAKGNCFVDHIRKLPLPVETWGIPEVRLKDTP